MLRHARAPAYTVPNQTQIAKYRYRRRLPHLQKPDAALFVTFCTGARLPLPEEARDLVVELSNIACASMEKEFIFMPS